MVQGTVVQGDFGPRRLLSKEAFTSDKLAQIIFFYFLLDITILIDYNMTKNNMNSLNVSNFFRHKFDWTKKSLFINQIRLYQLKVLF